MSSNHKALSSKPSTAQKKKKKTPPSVGNNPRELAHAQFYSGKRSYHHNLSLESLRLAKLMSYEDAVW
jgi:hypothetical protein